MENFKCLFVFIMFFPGILNAQKNIFTDSMESLNGIRFHEDLSWKQIKEKAKSENKYIFVDCFATWCAPCRQMDINVFSKKQVGDYFNHRFISVRVQMDKTQNDNDNIRNWYADAKVIKEKFRVAVLPTLLFFSPSGDIIHNEQGYKSVAQLLNAGAITLSSSPKQFKQYAAFVDAYRKGKRNYILMPEILMQGKRYSESELLDSISKDYFSYLIKLKEKKWYTKANIECITSYCKMESKSPFFSIFLNHSKKVDVIMKKKGYSKVIIDKVIMSEDIAPFLDFFYKTNSMKLLLTHTLEPNWDSLGNSILKKYGGEFSARCVRVAKSKFYWFVRNTSAYISNFIQRMNNSDMDTTIAQTAASINECAWFIFQKSNDYSEIEQAINWMKVIVEGKFFENTKYAPYDTYANLLYKSSVLFNTGRFDEALEWERRSLQKGKENRNQYVIDSRVKVIDKMINKIPTW